MKIWHSILIGGVMALCGLPFPWSPLIVIPLAALFFKLSQAKSPREASVSALLTGVVYFSGHLVWLPLSFMDYLGPVSLGFVVVWLLEGLFIAILAQIVTRLTSQSHQRVWLYACGWVLLEYLRHLGPFAFPWGTLGYALSPVPLVQVAEFGGLFLLSLLVTAMASSLAQAYQKIYAPLVGVGLLWMLGWGYGIWIQQQPQLPGDKTVLLVQPNYDVFDKFKGSDPVQLLQQHIEMSKSRQNLDELVVWSESAINGRIVLNTDIQEEPTAWFPQWAIQIPRPAILGLSTPLGSKAFANRAVAWDGVEVGHHDKHYLVPFGEFFPLYNELPFIYNWVFETIGSVFVPVQPGITFAPLELRGIRYGTYICYESVFPIVAREMVRQGAQVLVNISNDGWFGKGQGLVQHFEMGRVRAIETRRYILRAGSVGVTAVIGPLGEVKSSIPTRTENVLHGVYRSLEGQTLYVRFGDWPLALCLLFILATFIRNRFFMFSGRQKTHDL